MPYESYREYEYIYPKQSRCLCLKIFSVLLVKAVFLFSNPSFSETSTDSFESVTLGTADYPPLMGKKKGVLTDIVRAAYEAAGIQVNYAIYPISRIKTLLRTGEVPAVVGSANWFHSLDKTQNYASIPIYYSSMRFFYLRDRFPKGLHYDSMDELQRFSVAYVLGGSLIPLFEKHGIDTVLVPDSHQIVQMVLSGHSDMFAATELGGWKIIDGLEQEQRQDFAMSPKPIIELYGHITFANDQQRLQNLFRTGFERIKNKGILMDLLAPYFGDRPMPAKLLEILK